MKKSKEVEPAGNEIASSTAAPSGLNQIRQRLLHLENKKKEKTQQEENKKKEDKKEVI